MGVGLTGINLLGAPKSKSATERPFFCSDVKLGQCIKSWF